MQLVNSNKKSTEFVHRLYEAMTERTQEDLYGAHTVYHHHEYLAFLHTEEGAKDGTVGNRRGHGKRSKSEEERPLYRFRETI